MENEDKGWVRTWKWSLSHCFHNYQLKATPVLFMAEVSPWYWRLAEPLLGKGSLEWLPSFVWCIFWEGSNHAGAFPHEPGNGGHLSSTLDIWELLGIVARAEAAGTKPRFRKWHGLLSVTEPIYNQEEGNRLSQLKECTPSLKPLHNPVFSYQGDSREWVLNPFSIQLIV